MATATIILPESSAITKSSAEASGSDTSVATTEKIWICAVASGATARMVRRNTGGSNNQYSLTIAGGYASPPATLPGGFTQTAGRDQGVYFEIK
jgi:hypothetical protein